MFPSPEGQGSPAIFPDVTGVILAGGESRRMGSNKALLPFQGGRFIEAIQRHLARLFPHIVVVTNAPEQYAFLPHPKVADVYPGAGPLAGIHAALSSSCTDFIFTVACDMPYLNESVIRHLATYRHAAAVVIPQGGGGIEPLHAFYHRTCLSAMEGSLRAGQRRIVSFFDRVEVCYVPSTEIISFDPELSSFSNINTPAEYYRLRHHERGEEQYGLEKKGFRRNDVPSACCRRLLQCGEI